MVSRRVEPLATPAEASAASAAVPLFPTAASGTAHVDDVAPARAAPAASRSRLVSGESEVCNARLHWIVLSSPVLLLLTATALTAGLSGAPAPIPTAGLVALAAAAVHLLWRVLVWRDVRYVLTDRRVLMTTTFPTTRTASMGLRKITDMSYRQSVVGRVLGYGSIAVESAGQDQALSRLDRLADADAFHQSLSAQVFHDETAVAEDAG